MSTPKVNQKLLNQIFSQISGKFDEEEEPLPEIAIGGKGHLWCYDVTRKAMVRVRCGTRGFILSEETDEWGRILVYTMQNDVILIEPEKIYYMGYA
jgi:hypothetical protein